MKHATGNGLDLSGAWYQASREKLKGVRELYEAVFPDFYLMAKGSSISDSTSETVYVSIK